MFLYFNKGLEPHLQRAHAEHTYVAEKIRIDSPMNNFLHHPVRAALILIGILCALSAFTFFGAPVMMIPYIPIVFQFIASAQRALAVVGWLLLSLVTTTFIIGQAEIQGFQFEKLVVYGGPLLLLSASLHLLVSESRKGSKVNAQK